MVVRWRDYYNKKQEHSTHPTVDARNPSITYAELTSSLGINTSAVQKLVKRMVDNGYIVRHENGAWRVIATSVV